MNIKILKKLFAERSKIVLVAIQDDGSTYVIPALNALRRLGAIDPILVTFRGSFALAGYAQPNKPYWVTQEQQKRYEGPSMISLRIPLLQSHQTRKSPFTFFSITSAAVFVVMEVYQ